MLYQLSYASKYNPLNWGKVNKLAQRQSACNSAAPQFQSHRPARRTSTLYCINFCIKMGRTSFDSNLADRSILEHSMQKYRKLLILVLLLAVAGVAGYLLYRWQEGPPSVVRLLPEGDRLAYVNFKLVRPFWDLSKSKPLELEGNYQEFVDQTGIQFERDLDEAAISWQDTTDGRNEESAAIFVGHFDPARLKRYLQKVSSQTEIYRGLTIYTVPNGDHSVRVCVLDTTRVASTRSSVDTMRGIIDRTHESSRGPWLVQTYYHNVPSANLAWMISRIPAKSAASQIGGLTFSFLENTVTVGSLRYNGSLLVRVDIFAASEMAAKQVLDSATTFLAVYRSVGRTLGAKGGDPDVRAALESIRVEQQKNVVTVTGECSDKLLKKLQAEGKIEAIAPSSRGPDKPHEGERR